MECQRLGQRVTLAEMSRRLGRASYWLADPRNQTAVRCRAIIVSEWIAIAAEIPSFLPPSDLGQSTAPASLDDLDIGTAYPAGDDLLRVLNHPGRLAQFCSLVETAGPSGAFRYAQQVHSFYQANAANRTENAA
jgi:hypothetical protein